MDNDKILIDILNRLYKLEEQVNILLAEKDKSEGKMGTTEVKNYIAQLKNQHKLNGESSFEITANQIHKLLKLKNSMPIVCNAMKHSMCEGDEIVKQTASGYSSTLTIRYYL